MAKRKSDPLPSPENSSQAIIRILRRLSDNYSLMDLFQLFIEACNIALDEMPAFLSAPVGTDFRASQAWKDARLDKIKQDTYKGFAEGFAVLLAAVFDERGDRTYRDVVGPVYMDLLSGSRWNNDQFYTPKAVAECMAAMTMHDVQMEDEFARRCKAVIEDDPSLKMYMNMVGLVAMAVPSAEGDTRELFIRKIWPLLRSRVEPFKILDPCVGSGVLLLAAAKASPRWLIDIGFVQFYGMDIVQLAVRMAQLNMKLYGLCSRYEYKDKDEKEQVA